jgi:hypothetical protein
MGQCCEKEKDNDIPNITLKDMCKDIQCNCASSCCIKKPKHHTHHKHHHKDKDNKDDNK